MQRARGARDHGARDHQARTPEIQPVLAAEAGRSWATLAWASLAWATLTWPPRSRPACRHQTDDAPSHCNRGDFLQRNADGSHSSAARDPPRFRMRRHDSMMPSHPHPGDLVGDERLLSRSPGGSSPVPPTPRQAAKPLSSHSQPLPTGCPHGRRRVREGDGSGWPPSRDWQDVVAPGSF